MSTPQQHPTPDLDHLKLLARSLLTAYGDRSEEALSRVRAQLRRFVDPVEEPGGRPFGLQEAQFVVAREHGFESWADLKHHAETSEASLLASLMDATSAGHGTRVSRILDVRPSLVNALSAGSQRTPLRVASDSGHAEVVKLLLDRGADPNLPSEDGDPPLPDAAESGHVEVVNLLLEHGADPNGGNSGEVELCGWGTLYQMTMNDPEGKRKTKEQMVATLLAHGGQPSIFSAIFVVDMTAVRDMAARDPQVVERQMALHHNHRRPLHFAVANRRPEMVELLIDLGADMEAVDTDNLTSLDVAALCEAGECVRVLLDRGAIVRLPAACVLGSEQVIERDLGSNPGSLAPGATWGHLLATAASCGAADAIHRLVDKGASVNALHDDSATPLHLAAVAGHTGAVETLLSHGADATIKDSAYDSTALGWARWAGQRGTERVLLEHGATE